MPLTEGRNLMHALRIHAERDPIILLSCVLGGFGAFRKSLILHDCARAYFVRLQRRKACCTIRPLPRPCACCPSCFCFRERRSRPPLRSCFQSCSRDAAPPHHSSLVLVGRRLARRPRDALSLGRRRARQGECLDELCVSDQEPVSALIGLGQAQQTARLPSPLWVPPPHMVVHPYIRTA